MTYIPPKRRFQQFEDARIPTVSELVTAFGCKLSQAHPDCANGYDFRNPSTSNAAADKIHDFENFVECSKGKAVESYHQYVESQNS